MSRIRIQEPPVKAKPSVDLHVLASIHPELMHDSHVYVHCKVSNQREEMLVRIWRTTFLIDRDSSKESNLVHAENITYAPQWTFLPNNQDYNFLLIFSSLPKSCKRFDLEERTAGPGGFYVKSIFRNSTDVYQVKLM